MHDSKLQESIDNLLTIPINPSGYQMLTPTTAQTVHKTTRKRAPTSLAHLFRTRKNIKKQLQVYESLKGSNLFVKPV